MEVDHYRCGLLACKEHFIPLKINTCWVPDWRLNERQDWNKSIMEGFFLECFILSASYESNRAHQKLHHRIKVKVCQLKTKKPSSSLWTESQFVCCGVSPMKGNSCWLAMTCGHDGCLITCYPYSTQLGGLSLGILTLPSECMTLHHVCETHNAPFQLPSQNCTLILFIDNVWGWLWMDFQNKKQNTHGKRVT